MRRILLVLLAFVMLLSLCACGNDDTQTTEPSTTPSQTITNSTQQTADNTEGTTEATRDSTDEPTTAPTDEPTTPPTQAPTEAPTTPPAQDSTEAPTTPPAQDPTEAPTTPPPQVPATEPVDNLVYIESISLNFNEYTMVKGTTVTLEAIVFPSNATETVKWESVDTSVATVENGIVKAVGNGTTTIVASASYGGVFCQITVYTPVQGVSFEQSDYIVYRNSSVSINANIHPMDASNRWLIWSSSDDSIVRVTNGTAVGISNGTATITAQTEDGGFSAQCTVTVVDAPLSLQCGLRHTTFIDGWKEGLLAEVVIGGGNGNYSNYSFNITIYHNGNVVKSASNIPGNSYNSGWIAVLNVTLTEIKQYYHGGVGWDDWSGNYTAVFEVIDDSGNSHTGTATYTWQ